VRNPNDRSQHRVTTRASAVLALALSIGLAACSDPEPVPEPVPEPLTSAPASASPLPMTIDGIPLVGVTAGADAERFIGRLHGEDVAPLNSYVGQYQGGGAAATLYLSQFPDSATADSLTTLMSDGIGTGSQVFAHHTSFVIDDVVVHSVLGQGQTHFFFASGPDVTWLGIDSGQARAGLADLLGVPTDALPESYIAEGGP
jgi:hypothetical protein